MAYTKQNFTDGQVLTSEHLNNIEDGIVAVENSKVSKSGDTITGNLGITGALTVDRDLTVKGGSIELNQGGTLAGYGGFIDFHYDRSTDDYTSRIIEDASGRLSVNAPNGFRINSKLLLDLTYPVGSIYMSVSSTSPASLFGGTWAQIKGRFLLASGDNGDGWNYTANTTGGSPTVELDYSNLPHYTLIMQKSTNGNLWATGKWDNGHSIATGDYYSVYVGNTSYGSGVGVNKLPPYLAVYMWKRTA